MAFSLFKRRDEDKDPARESVEAKVAEVGTPSDVLLTTLIRGESISRDQALAIPAVAANVDFISNCIAV